MKKYIRFIFVFIFTVISFISCSKNKVSELERVNLFSLNYGNFDDELNLFDLSNIGEINTKIIMSDGFFYISNSEAKKIIKLNSYGDLLSIFYNDEANPHPFIADKNENGKNATRTATYYPFNEISYLAVDSLKNLFVVEKLPSERCEFDSKLNISLSQVVLRFDTNGNFIDYIGQEGPGGMPFPFIKNIFVMKNGELVVVTSVGQSYTVYYYKTSGYLQKKVIIKSENIPNPYLTEDKDSYFSIGAVYPSYDLKLLYMKVDYYTSYIDDSTHVMSGIDYESTQVYPLDIETSSYGEPFIIPPYTEQLSQGFSVLSYEMPYDFIGVTENNWMFFMVSTDEGLCIQMIQCDGQRNITRKLDFNRQDSLYYSINLNDTGIISLLSVEKDKACIAWWRTDSLIMSVLKN